jgi:DNA repair protein RadA/Sms
LAKSKTSFVCQNCGANSAKWVGKCPSCGEWNTYVEELIIPESHSRKTWSSKKESNKPTKIQEVSGDQTQRFQTGNDELDRVLGGGLVQGSLILVGGEPGIGKSTLLLQISIQLVQKKILYVSGEESLPQIKMRANRIGVESEQCYLLSETDLNRIMEYASEMEPDVLIIDSIQTIHFDKIESAPGSIAQVRECAGHLMRYAKESDVAVFLIGHINKEGSIAGPKVLEHMVDTVLQFEGDRHHTYRILRTSKNRFGSTSELGIYEMHGGGLREVSNPSEILLSSHRDNAGVAVGAIIEGNRPLLVEVQALVGPATYTTPQRSTTGFDQKRLHMLLAVLEKRMGLRLGNQDVFLNITGGIRVDDPALDLAICSAIYSSYHDIPVDNLSCFVGEIGLGGEIRSVNRLEIRIGEVQRLGFRTVYFGNVQKWDQKSSKIQIEQADNLRGTFEVLFG